MDSAPHKPIASLEDTCKQLAVYNGTEDKARANQSAQQPAVSDATGGDLSFRPGALGRAPGGDAVRPVERVCVHETWAEGLRGRTLGGGNCGVCSEHAGRSLCLSLEADCPPQRQWLEGSGSMQCGHREKPGILLTAATRGSEASALGNGDTVMSLVARMKHRKGMKASQFEGRKKGFVWMY